MSPQTSMTVLPPYRVDTCTCRLIIALICSSLWVTCKPERLSWAAKWNVYFSIFPEREKLLLQADILSEWMFMLFFPIIRKSTFFVPWRLISKTFQKLLTDAQEQGQWTGGVRGGLRVLTVRGVRGGQLRQWDWLPCHTRVNTCHV